MNERTVILAVEDVLSEAVSSRILMSLGIAVGQRLGLRGKGYLRNKARSLNPKFWRGDKAGGCFH